MSNPAAPPADDASEDVLASLEAMLDEVTSERDARQRLIAEAGGAPKDPAPARPKTRSAALESGFDPDPAPAPDTTSAPGPGSPEARIAALHAKIEKARAGLVNRDARIAELRAERDALRAELEEMRASRSWRLTAPLRKLRG